MRKGKYRFELLWWETVTLVVVGVLLVIVISVDFCANEWKAKYSTFLSVTISFLTGIVAAIVVLALERYHRTSALIAHYIKISGTYTRVDIGQDNTLEEKQIRLRDENVGLRIQLNYIGGHSFSHDMELWKSENARAKGVVVFDEVSKSIGSGTYKYYQGQRYENHFGALTLYWFDQEPNKLFVLYHHVYPRAAANNPDANRGWQLWEKLGSEIER